MRHLFIVLAGILIASCGRAPTQPPPVTGDIVAFVNWQGVGLAARQVELLDLKEVKFTDSTGHAAFTVPAGAYTLRAYNINRGGPAYRSIDFSVRVTAGESVAVDIVDCLPCL